MRSVLAIATIAVRSAIRSRVVVSLLAILALVVFGLPATVKGDGSIEGHARLLVNYTLGFATFIIALASLWAGCAAISTEVDGRQIQLVAVKPVRRLHIWLGKWLGLTLINTVLLVLCGLATYGLLVGHARRLPEADAKRLRENVLVSRRAVAPRALDVDRQARALLQQRVADGALPEGMAPDDALNAIRRSILGQAYTVAPGSTCAWSFDLASGTREVTLKYRIAASRADIVRLKGLWIAGDTRHTATMVPGAWQEWTVRGLTNATLEVQFANVDEQGVTVMFSPDDGLAANCPAGSFEGNFLRALFVVWTHLAFLTALGVTAGALFSMPVASFVTLYAVILLQATDYVSRLAKQSYVVTWDHAQGSSGALNAAVALIFKVLNVLLQPLSGGDALGALASGQLVSWAWVGHDVVIKLVLYGALLGASGVYLFNRRELALPS